jgi:hypothetical protein
MATDYENQWLILRVDWAKSKIRKWAHRLETEQSRVERRELVDDIEKMKRALKDWEADLDA